MREGGVSLALPGPASALHLADGPGSSDGLEEPLGGLAWSFNQRAVSPRILPAEDARGIETGMTAPRFDGGQEIDWRLDERLNELIEARIIEPLLLVAMDFDDRARDYTPWKDPEEGGGEAATFIPFLLALKEAIDANYPTLTGAEDSCLLGSSLGGLFALYTGRKFPEIFSRIAAMSPSFWWDGERMLYEIEVSQRHDKQMIYLDSGTGSDELTTPEKVRRVSVALQEDGWVVGDDLEVRLFEGAKHNEWEWGQRIGEPLRFLFPWKGQ